ncbi:MAG: tetratricopeptide repeat protein [Candidatus Krumholzibacteria bacterium]|nr:tetratricopeptide repeat protein [Candidatus Krumholzibacteria bacterium]
MNRFIRIFFIVMIGLILASSAFFPSALWGVSAWHDASFTLGFIIAGLSLLLLFPGIRDRGLRLFTTERKYPLWARVIFYLAAFGSIFLLRQGHLLWGELNEAATLIESGRWVSPGAPLATAINQAVFRLFNPLFFWTPGMVTALVSILSGLLFIPCAKAAALAVAGGHSGNDATSIGDGDTGGTGIGEKDDPARLTPERTITLSTLYLIANGFVVLFFGGSGLIPPAIVFSTLFIVTSIRFIEGRSRLFIPVFLFILAVASHLSAVYLVAGLATLMIIAFRRTSTRNEALVSTAILVLAATAIEIIMRNVPGGVSPIRFIWFSCSSAVTSISAVSAGRTIANWGNALLIIGPASIASLAIFVRGPKKPEEKDKTGTVERFLSVLVISALTIALILSHRIENGLGWDMIAVMGPALAILALFSIRRRSVTLKSFVSSILLLAVLGSIHSAALVIISSSQDRGVARLSSLPLAPGLASKIAGIRAYEREDYEAAAASLEISVEEAADDAATWFYLGKADMKNEDYIDAISYFIRSLRIEPENRAYRENLAEAYMENRWFGDAVNEFSTLASSDPANIHYWKRLGFAANRAGEYEIAIDAYSRVLSLEPQKEQNIRSLASAILNQGAEFHQDKMFEEAKRNYYRVLSMLPRNWAAKNNLANVFMDEGDFDEAWNILDGALRDNDMAPKLHFNMGIVQEARGNYEDAYRHLTRSVELNPNAPAPQDILDRVWEKLQAEKESPADSRR